MGNLAKSLKLALGTSVVTAVATVALPVATSAWKVNYEAAAQCKDNTAVVSWSFKNTEPNQAKWSMDVEITDAQTGGKTVKTVAPGQTVSGTFTSSKTKLANGKVYFKMLWTDGRSGVDTRSSDYAATPECKPYVAPTFDANVICTVVDNKAVFTLNVRQTGGDSDLTFNPKNGTVLTDATDVVVVGLYTKNGKTEKITKTVSAENDCTPESKIKVCRNGSVIEIMASEKQSTDRPAPCPEILGAGAATELPQTGAGSVIGLIAAVFATSTVFAQMRMRRQNR